jgi:galactokinase
LRHWYPDIAALRDVSLEQFQAHDGDLPEVIARRCRFIIEENQRVLDLAEALSQGDQEHLNCLFAASYRGACDLYEIGAPAMDAMRQAVLSAPGVVAARQAGAGFGGCMVALVQREQVSAFADRVTSSYHTATNIEPQVYPVQAAPGAAAL